MRASGRGNRVDSWARLSDAALGAEGKASFGRTKVLRACAGLAEGSALGLPGRSTDGPTARRRGEPKCASISWIGLSS
jgi:hypothetical protein